MVRAIAILEAQPPGPALAYAHANAALVAVDAGRLEEALAWATQALDFVDTVGGTQTRIIALRVLGRVENLRGRSDIGFAAYEAIRQIAIESGDQEAAVVALTEAGCDLTWMRRYDEALDHFREAIELGRAVDLDRRVRTAEAFVCGIHFEQGRWGEAEAIAARLLAEQPPHLFVRSRAMTIQARIATRRGDRNARVSLDAAWQLFDDTFPADLWEIAAARAEHAWLDGHPERIAGDRGRSLGRCGRDQRRTTRRRARLLVVARRCPACPFGRHRRAVRSPHGRRLVGRGGGMGATGMSVRTSHGLGRRR